MSHCLNILIERTFLHWSKKIQYFCFYLHSLWFKTMLDSFVVFGGTVIPGPLQLIMCLSTSLQGTAVSQIRSWQISLSFLPFLMSSNTTETLKKLLLFSILPILNWHLFRNNESLLFLLSFDSFNLIFSTKKMTAVFWLVLNIKWMKVQGR